MAIRDDGIVGRAAKILREAPEPGWRAIEDDVVHAVKATPRSGWPLDVTHPTDASTPGILRVSELVLTARLSAALAGDPDYVATDISTHFTGTALQKVSVELSGRYQADLKAAAARVDKRCRIVLAEIIGRDDAQVTVTVTDVHT